MVYVPLPLSFYLFNSVHRVEAISQLLTNLFSDHPIPKYHLQLLNPIRSIVETRRHEKKDPLASQSSDLLWNALQVIRIECCKVVGSV